MIIITGFRQGVEKATTADGQPGLIPCDFVSYVPAHAPQSMANEEKVRRLDPEIALKKLPEGTEGGEKIAHMRAIWDQIKPAYDAWKEGRELPLVGTPLLAWPGITTEMAEVFRLCGIRTVEQVRDMNDALRSKVRLPNTRELQELAKLFLENSGAAAAAEREAAKDREIADMREEMAAMRALLEEAAAERAKEDPETKGRRKAA